MGDHINKIHKKTAGNMEDSEEYGDDDGTWAEDTAGYIGDDKEYEDIVTNNADDFLDANNDDIIVGDDEYVETPNKGKMSDSKNKKKINLNKKGNVSDRVSSFNKMSK